ncbi:MAG: hypothetical protein GY828_02645 [Candidatus Gracilibacteria bacterium]|nr:hypothetical protein [Candidatus Gracilibacteria bacterium]
MINRNLETDYIKLLPETTTIFDELRNRGVEIPTLYNGQEPTPNGEGEYFISKLVDKFKDHKQLNTVIETLNYFVDKDLSRYNYRRIYWALRTPLVRGLGVTKNFIAVFEKEKRPVTKQETGHVISIIATEEDIEWMKASFLNKKHGYTVCDLASGLGRLLGLDAIPIIIQRLDDISICPSVIEELGNLRAIDTEELIQPFLQHESAEYRKIARKALSKIETAKKRLAKKNK